MNLKSTTLDDYKMLLDISKKRLHTFNTPNFLWFNLLFSALAVFFVLMDDKVFNRLELIVCICYGIQLAVTAFFLIERIAFRFQQWLWVWISLLSILFAHVFYIVILSAISTFDMMPDNIFNIIIGLMIFGAVNMLGNVPYAFSRVRKGHFRAGGKMLFNFRNPRICLLLSLPVLVVWCLIYGYWDFGVASNLIELDQIRRTKILLGCSFTIQVVFGYVWTEFLLMTYCKFRFREFWNVYPFEPFSLAGMLDEVSFWFKHPFYAMKSRAGWYLDRVAPWWASVIAFTEFTAAVFATLTFLVFLLNLISGTTSWQELMAKGGLGLVAFSVLIAAPYYIILKIVYRIRRKHFNKSEIVAVIEIKRNKKRAPRN